LTIQREKEDSELRSAQNVIKYKMKEDEIDTILLALDGILVNKISYNQIIIYLITYYKSKRRDKYDHNITKLSKETKSDIEELINRNKVKF